MAMPETRPRGRRPDPNKRRAIFEAAREVFFSQGYGASMDTIAQRAGVSKQTIYNLFENKEDLLAAAMAETTAEMTASLREERPGSGPADALTELARAWLDVVLAPRSVALVRALATQNPQLAGLVQVFYRNGPAVTLSRTADYLAEQTARGRLAVADPTLAAEQFFGMLAGPNHLRLLLGIAEPPTGLERERRIAACVAAFLKAHGT